MKPTLVLGHLLKVAADILPAKLDSQSIGQGISTIGNRLMSPEERQSLDDYIAEAKKWKSGVDPRDAMSGYAIHGNRAAQTKPWGVSLPDFMVGSRKVLGGIADLKANNPFASQADRAAAQDEAKMMTVDDTTAKHYGAFVDSPFAGYTKRMEEFYNLPQEDFNKPGNAASGSVYKVLDRLQSGKPFTSADLQLNEPEYAANTNTAAGKLLQDVGGKLPRNINEYWGKNNPRMGEMSQAIGAYHKALPQGMDKLKAFKQFDPWLKTQNPNLWKDKQVMDFGGGTIAANIHYPEYMQMGKNVQDKLVQTGNAIATAGNLANKFLKK